MRDICREAVDAAIAAGASYADARVVRRRAQMVATKDRRVETLNDLESEGVGVRVLVGGAWGFACDRRLDAAAAREAAARACAFARAAGAGRARALAPVAHGNVDGAYRTPLERDPFD